MAPHDEFDDARDRLREMHRNRPERRLAGVCAALADRLEIPLPLVRGAFLIGAFIPGANSLVIAAYLALWFLTPPAYDQPSGLDRVIDAVRDLLGMDSSRRAGSEGFPES
ncbi:MAG TPA: PspC domain-containing protein [Myxococcota bacterium]|nr:PspC domain-containing protein [Myxococcota bacterium]